MVRIMVFMVKISTKKQTKTEKTSSSFINVSQTFFLQSKVLFSSKKTHSKNLYYAISKLGFMPEIRKEW